MMQQSPHCSLPARHFWLCKAALGLVPISPGLVLPAAATAAAAADEDADDEDSEHHADCNDEGFKVYWITQREER